MLMPTLLCIHFYKLGKNQQNTYWELSPRCTYTKELCIAFEHWCKKKIYGNLTHVISCCIVLLLLSYVEQQITIYFSKIYKFTVWLDPTIHKVWAVSRCWDWTSPVQSFMSVKRTTHWTTVHTCYKKCDVINSGPKSSCQNI